MDVIAIFSRYHIGGGEGVGCTGLMQNKCLIPFTVAILNNNYNNNNNKIIIIIIIKHNL